MQFQMFDARHLRLLQSREKPLFETAGFVNPEGKLTFKGFLTEGYGRQ